MTSTLRQVLNKFEERSGAISLSEMAQELDITLGALEGMIHHWVRKGKLREVDGSTEQCHVCGIKGECSLVMTMPRYYELVSGGDSAPEDSPPSCPRCG